MLEVDDLRSLRIFAGLSDEQLADLVGAGTEEHIRVGVELFREGDPADSWWVLLDGALELLRHSGQEYLAVGRMEVPGQWAGGFRAWDERGVYLATGIGVRPGRLLRIPADELRRCTDAWFPLGGHLIAGLFNTARSIEATARQRESLVTLGRLAAGLAHELNNPASAATRAVDDVDGTARVLQTSLERLVQAGVTPDGLDALRALRERLLESPVRLRPLELADREEVLADWLDDHDVAGAWTLAPALAAAGADTAWCEEAKAALGASALEPALAWLASSLTLDALVTELKQSTRRVSDVVGAMKSYSQMDRASLQRIDVKEGLESSLVILGHRIPEGVKVVRDYPPETPVVEAYAGELNQVWTNLIDNALDAMDGAGTLRVAVRADDGAAVVEIADTGPGIPPAIAERAFEPFFTTKPVGKGAGLGLDIARRIVEERHAGTIAIDSRPGDTTLRVRLPYRARRT